MFCLERVVKDRRVLGLINSALKERGNCRLEPDDDGKWRKGAAKKKKKKGGERKGKVLNPNEPKPDPYWLRTFFDFAPEEAAKVPNYGHCGILSPLLANVCLNELDHMMEEKIVEFFRPSMFDSIWKDSSADGCHNPAWPEFVPSGGKEKTMKMDYIRYGASLPQCIRRFRRLELLKGDKDPEPLPCTPMLYSSQAHTNSQMNKFLETMADWYQYADNRKKAVGFCAYVIRSSLAKLYAARYKLKSRAKVYKIASRSLSHPLRNKGNKVTPEYSDAMKLGLVESIEGVQFSHMALIPSCDYTPFPRVWIPEHEQLLFEYIKLQDPKFFSELLKSIKTQGLNASQNEISQIVWDFKTLGVHRFAVEPKEYP
ncbi:Nuclear intron maturase 1 mitochondrial [Bienertia sinuspersici]